ncbi:hypothetical protein ATERTT37_006783 [Aspergillus terreus]
MYYELALRTALLEKEYQATLGHTAQLLDAEKSRVTKVEQLLLQFENETLRYQLDRADRELANMMKEEYKSRSILDGARQELNELRNQQRFASQEIERLRNELATINNTTAGSKELLAEISRLSKDLADSRAEIERLASQCTSTNTTIAEKQALERQLNTLEVQREDEKRAHERSLAKLSKQGEELYALRSSLEEARRQLVKEVEARKSQERVSHQQSQKAYAQRLASEDGSETLNKKPRQVHEQSQATQGAHYRQPENRNEAGNTVRSRITAIEQSNSRLNPELTIATPGAVRVQSKKPKVSALPGDKSSFSITPFLNRTTGLRDSLSSDNESDELHSSTPIMNTTKAPGKTKKNEIQVQDRDGSVSERPSTESKQHLEQTSSEVKVAKEGQRKPADVPKIDDRSDGSSILSTHLTLAQAKTRKRKLGAQRDRSIFDDDDDEEDDDFKGMRKQGRKLAGPGRNVGVQSSAMKAGPLSLGRGFGGFSEFSPLKKDRKRL